MQSNGLPSDAQRKLLDAGAPVNMVAALSGKAARKAVKHGGGAVAEDLIIHLEVSLGRRFVEAGLYGGGEVLILDVVVGCSRYTLHGNVHRVLYLCI